jgi:hypothetical protein
MISISEAAEDRRAEFKRKYPDPVPEPAPNDPMTWGQFKRHVEQHGVKDNERIWYMDFSFPDHGHNKPSVGRGDTVGVVVH